MKLLLFILAMPLSINPHTIFDFNVNADIQNWAIVDDVVMGGRSSGTFSIDAEGFGIFKGSISLKNNGGFSSVRYKMDRTNVNKYTKIVIKLRGDGKAYQFRVKANSRDYYSYTSTFVTTGEWQQITIPLKDMYPVFRGRKLDMPNFSNEYMEEINILIANKKEERFKLMIDKITLE